MNKLSFLENCLWHMEHFDFNVVSSIVQKDSKSGANPKYKNNIMLEINIYLCRWRLIEAIMISLNNIQFKKNMKSYLLNNFSSKIKIRYE